MAGGIKLIRGNDRINRLAQRPGIAADVAQIRADMAEADRTYTMGLAALRQAAELTQVESPAAWASPRPPSAAWSSPTTLRQPAVVRWP